MERLKSKTTKFFRYVIPIFMGSVFLLFTVSQIQKQRDRKSEIKFITNKSYSQKKTASELESSRKRMLVRHDFGLIRTGEIRQHRFEVANNTSSNWTFSGLETSCTCTVSSFSSQVILAGHTEWVDVRYHAGKTSGDDRRTVTAHFSEPDSPTFYFEVTARVRDPLTLSKDHLQFKDIAKGHTSKREFYIYNFSDSDYKSITVIPEMDWLRTSVAAFPVAGVVDEPRQCWLATVVADTKNIRSDPATSGITVRIEGTDIMRKIGATLTIMSPVKAIPSQLFIANAGRQRISKGTISLHFAPEAVVKDRDSIQIEHNLGDRLRIQTIQGRGNTWTLLAELTPALADDQFLNGQIMVKFRPDTLPTVVIPVKVLVK